MRSSIREEGRPESHWISVMGLPASQGRTSISWLVDGGIRDRGGGVLAGVGLDVAVAGVGHEQGSLAARGEPSAHGKVAGVEAAHKAHGQEGARQGVVLLDDADGLLHRGGQGLLAQGGQPGVEAGVDEVGVEGVGNGDDDGVHRPGTDHLGSVGEDLIGPDLGGEDLGPVDVGVGDGDERGAPNATSEVVGVVGSHDAGADDSDAQGVLGMFHNVFLSVENLRTRRLASVICQDMPAP